MNWYDFGNGRSHFDALIRNNDWCAGRDLNPEPVD
jgi:hypothetical protein